MIVFGPVPSRRLGRSLGINNIPPKHCSYSCLYCQVGPTKATEIQPCRFYKPDQVFNEVRKHLAKLKVKGEGEPIDFLTFVPEGEPTLDSGLGDSIELLRSLYIKIAIITNGSLLWQKKVREVLKLADWVSLKVDSVDESVWRKINRPHEGLELEKILSGVEAFSSEFTGSLVTETMLLERINTEEEGISRLAAFLQKLTPGKAYLSVPTRPPANSSVRGPDEDVLNRIYQVINRKIPEVELLTGYEGNAFASSGNFVDDLMAITSVHPMRKEAVLALLKKTNTHWSVVQELLKEGKIREIKYKGNNFYIRTYHRK